MSRSAFSRFGHFALVLLGLRALACGGGTDDKGLFGDGQGGGSGEGGSGGEAAGTGGSTSGSGGTTTFLGGGGSAGAATGGAATTGGAAGTTPFGAGGGGAGGAGPGPGGAGPGAGGGPGPGGGGSGGKGGTAGKGGGSAGSGAAGNVVPTTCSQAHEYPGCCGPDGKVYWCEQNGTMVQSLVCDAGKVCGWDATSMLYNCTATASSDPSGANPKSCGP